MKNRIHVYKDISYAFEEGNGMCLVHKNRSFIESVHHDKTGYFIFHSAEKETFTKTIEKRKIIKE